MTPAPYAAIRIAEGHRRELLDRAYDARRLRAARRAELPERRRDERPSFAWVARLRRSRVRG